MPEFLIDQCVTIRARDQEAAAFHAQVIANHLRDRWSPLVSGVHTCHVEQAPPEANCEGHPAGPFDPMGQTAYCDGTCQPKEAA